eukprot:gene4117-4363_t
MGHGFATVLFEPASLPAVDIVSVSGDEKQVDGSNTSVIALPQDSVDSNSSEDVLQDSALAKVDQHFNGPVSAMVKMSGFRGKQGEMTPPVVISSGKTLFLLGLGPASDITTCDWGQSTYHGVALARGTLTARFLVEAPANVCTPSHLAAAAAHIAALAPDRFTLKILNEAECTELGMGLFVGVAKGSDEPLKFIHLTYAPQGAAKHKVALIGKGLTFDSGGYNLKVQGGIETMKCDMGGAGAVLGAARAILDLKPEGVEVHFITAACENMVSGRATKPSDIHVSAAGKTVEVNDTDAEGRLTLADALWYAQQVAKAETVIDIATLTGAAGVALGQDTAALFANNDSLATAIDTAGRSAGEKFWRLPLNKCLKKQLESPIADMKNYAGRWGGAITAALFLQEFISEGRQWGHLDVAGPAWDDAASLPTGFEARLLGCFRDPELPTGGCGTLDQKPFTLLQVATKTMTVDACATLARARNFSFAALANGRECFGGTFRAVAGGAALGSMSQVKQAILLSGGVMTSMVAYEDLTAVFKPSLPEAFSSTSNKSCYNTSSTTIDGTGMLVNLHAIFCYGWDDSQQYWLCKNSLGAGWELPGGSVRVAYGAASIMQSHYTFALEYVEDGNGVKALHDLRQNSVADAQMQGCYLYSCAGMAGGTSSVSAKRVLQLAAQLHSAWAGLFSQDLVHSRPAWADILQDLVLSNGLLQPPASQLDALLQVKAALDPNNFTLTDWSRTKSAAPNAICEWKGIACDVVAGVIGQVVAIKLAGLSLGGVLPSALTLQGLPNLVELDLSNCNLGGVLPAGLTGLPLQKITFANNKITGSLPSEWAGLAATLHSLDVSTNLLSGELPSGWSSLTNLEELYLASNLFSSQPLPPGDGWQVIRLLSLERNQFTAMPVSYGNLVTMKELRLFGNSISALPASLGNLTQLETLLAHQNRLFGALPSELGSMDALKQVTLYGNRDLKGCLPLAWQSHVNLAGSSYSWDDLTRGTGITAKPLFCAPIQPPTNESSAGGGGGGWTDGSGMGLIGGGSGMPGGSAPAPGCDPNAGSGGGDGGGDAGGGGWTGGGDYGR